MLKTILKNTAVILSMFAGLGALIGIPVMIMSRLMDIYDKALAMTITAVVVIVIVSVLVGILTGISEYREQNKTE